MQEITFSSLFLVEPSGLPFWSDISYGRIDNVKKHWDKRPRVIIGNVPLEPLGFACKYGQYETVRWMVDEKDQDVNGGDNRLIPLVAIGTLVSPLGQPFNIQDHIDCFQFLVQRGARRGLDYGLALVLHHFFFLKSVSKPPVHWFSGLAQLYISHGARLNDFLFPHGRLSDWNSHFRVSLAWRQYGKCWYETTCEDSTRNHEIAKDAVVTVLAIRKFCQSVLSPVPRDVLLLIVRDVWECRHDFELWTKCKKKRRRTRK